MLKYYKKVNLIGLTTCVGFVNETEELPNDAIQIDKSEYDRINQLINPPDVDELSGEAQEEVLGDTTEIGGDL